MNYLNSQRYLKLILQSKVIYTKHYYKKIYLLGLNFNPKCSFTGASKVKE